MMFVVFVVLVVLFWLTLMVVFAAVFGCGLHRFWARNKRRKALKQLVEVLTARQQLFDLHADVGTLIRCLLKGTIIAGKGHVIGTSQRY